MSETSRSADCPPLVLRNCGTKPLPILKDAELDYKWLAKWLHNTYESVAIRVGWKTQKKCRVHYRELPMANKAVMLQVATLLIDHLRKSDDTVLLAHERYWKERLESAMGRSVPKEVEHCRSCLIAIQSLRGTK